MLKLYVWLMTLLFTPQTQQINVKRSDQVLGVSVLLRAKQYTVDEQTLQIKRGMAGCSGTFVSGTEVLTAAHCFSRPTTDIWVRGADFKVSYRATLSHLDPEHDLALLKIHGVTNHPYARLARNVRVGEQIINVGSPMMFEFLLSEGIIAALNFTDKAFKAKFTITTAMINAGSSGGGAFNAAGELVGVNTMSVGFFGWTGISMAVDLATIRGFLAGRVAH